METSVLNCVNPYDVNPISGTTIGDSQEKNASFGHQIKLEMEEFSDLEPFLPCKTQNITESSTDELNTPIFDRKGPFDFMTYENPIESSPAADPFNFECDNSVISNRQHNDFSVYSNNNNNNNIVSGGLQSATNNSEVVNIVQGSEANNLIFATSETNQGNIYIINNNTGNETPIKSVQSEDQLSAAIFKIEDTNSVVSVNSNENQYSNVSSPCDESLVTIAQQRNNLGIETPEDSNSSSYTGSEKSVKKVPKLKLDLDYNQTMILTTPDVIDSVVDLETNFNILDYINEKDVTTVNIEDIHFENPSTSKGINSKFFEPKLRKRKRKYDDDDEDYIPPMKRQSASRKVSIQSSDSESEQEITINRRGRPPRRTSSVSSDHSDASKYRELRDKNNEASRKSRLKRKMKELSLQKEAEELYEKNVKLKAQVEEYERMVNNFRNNLFKIMLKK